VPHYTDLGPFDKENKEEQDVLLKPMKTFLTLLIIGGCLFGTLLSNGEETTNPPKQEEKVIRISLDIVKDAADPQKFITSVSCSLPLNGIKEGYEIVGAWTELLQPLEQKVLARHSAFLNIKDGVVTIWGFFPGAHGLHSKTTPGFVFELKDRNGKIVYAPLGRPETKDELEGKPIEVIEVPDEFKDRKLPPKEERTNPKPKRRGYTPPNLQLPA